MGLLTSDRKILIILVYLFTCSSILTHLRKTPRPYQGFVRPHTICCFNKLWFPFLLLTFLSFTRILVVHTSVILVHVRIPQGLHICCFLCLKFLLVPLGPFSNISFQCRLSVCIPSKIGGPSDHHPLPMALCCCTDRSAHNILSAALLAVYLP